LKSTGNNKKRAAQILGISLRTLHSRVTEFAAQDDPKHADSLRDEMESDGATG